MNSLKYGKRRTISHSFTSVRSMSAYGRQSARVRKFRHGVPQRILFTTQSAPGRTSNLTQRVHIRRPEQRF